MGGVVSSIIGFGVGEVGRQNESKREKNAMRTNAAQQDDLSMRREATYRADRSRLQGAIDSFYKQKGWEIPERLPGYGTTRQLPFEKPLYNQDGTANTQPMAPKYVESDSAADVEGGSEGTSTGGKAAPSSASTADGQVADLAPKGKADLVGEEQIFIKTPRRIVRSLVPAPNEARQILGYE